VTIPTAREQTWQGRASCSGLTQLVRNWESLACLQLFCGSPIGAWRMPCSYRPAAQWQILLAVSHSLFNWSMLGRGSSAAFLLPRPGKCVFRPSPCWTHPARVAMVAFETTDLASISMNVTCQVLTNNSLHHKYNQW